MVLVVCTALLWSAGAAGAGNLSADEYLALSRSLDAASPQLSVLKADPSGCIGKVIQLKGSVNGIVSSGDSVSFILDCEGESLLVKAQSGPPDCIANGNTIRALVRVGPGCMASLSDLQLEGAAYDYDVSMREKQLAPKSKASTAPSAVASRGSSPAAFPSSQQARGARLSSRAVQVFKPYRTAIAGFNPKLTDRELDMITASILAFSEHYQVDPRLVVALILTESGFRPGATSPKGAMGLGQLMPGTAQGLGVGNAYDPVQNIEASIRLIRGHLNNYGDLALALSAYNAGGGAVRKYGGVPPYRETQNYVRRVSQIYKALCGR